MKKLIKSFTLLLSIGCLISCVTQRPISKLAPGNNETYKVEYLFEHDGCKVYRFMDYGHFIYFTNCNNSVLSVENDSTQMHVENIKLNKVQR